MRPDAFVMPEELKLAIPTGAQLQKRLDSAKRKRQKRAAEKSNQGTVSATKSTTRAPETTMEGPSTPQLRSKRLRK